MERDGPSPPLDALVPPPDPRTVYRTAAAGAALCGVAAAVGLGLDLTGNGAPGPLSTLRLLRGPASLLYCLVTYDTIDPKTGKPEAEWLKIPTRGEHLKDPLALTYYRRLSVTEQVSQTIPDYVTPASFEKLDVRVRRMKAAAGE